MSSMEIQFGGNSNHLLLGSWSGDFRELVKEHGGLNLGGTKQVGARDEAKLSAAWESVARVLLLSLRSLPVRSRWLKTKTWL